MVLEGEVVAEVRELSLAFIWKVAFVSEGFEWLSRRMDKTYAEHAPEESGELAPGSAR